MILLSQPEIRSNEWKYIKECLDTNWVSSAGKFVDQFEYSLANYVGAEYAIACINGTAALHIALLIASVKPNEEVIVPALTFVAPVNAIRYVGAYPVFIDIQKDIWQMDSQKVFDFLTKECHKTKKGLINKNTGRKLGAIIIVHLLGHPVDMDPILDIAGRFGLLVIEDVAESLGAKYKGRKLGTLGNIATFSFNGNKIITTGGGGMIVTNNKSLADKARYLTTQAKDDAEEYIHSEIGYNYRLSNIQAAMGVAQMECLKDYISAKRRIASYYNKGLQGLSGITLPIEAEWAESIFWLYTIMVDNSSYGMSSRDLLQKLRESEIQSRSLWHPVYTLKPFRKCYAYKVEVADQLYAEGLSLPSSVGIKKEEQDEVIRVVMEARDN